MAIYKEDIVDINLETGNIHRSFLGRSIGTADSGADHFGVRVFRDGAAVSLSGVSVQGYFRDSHGNNIAITSGNSVSGNVAKVVLPQACYNYEGQFVLAIKLVGGGVTGTVRIVDGVVDNTNTGGAVAPTSTVPTYQEVLALYEQAIAVVNNSVRYNEAQSLTDTQKAQARTNISATSEEETAHLKSALVSDIASATTFEHGGIRGTTGANEDAANMARCDYIYVDSAVKVSIGGASSNFIYVYYYNSQKVYQGTSGIQTSYSLTNFNGYIRVALRNTSISELSDADIATMKAALHIERNNASQSIDNIHEDIKTVNSEVSAKVKYEVDITKPYNLLTNTKFTPDKYVDTGSGELKTSVSGEYASDYIPIDPAQGYICKNTNVYSFRYDVETGTYHQTYDNSFTRYLFAFYDINKVFIPFTGTITDTSAAIPENARYIRVTLSSADAIKTARLIYGNYNSKPNMRQVEPALKPSSDYAYKPRTGFEDFKMVMFGDSITFGDPYFGVNDPVSYVDYAADYLGATIYNVGLGGTRMALPPNETLSGRFLMSFFNLCDCITSDSHDGWDEIEEYLETPGEEGYLPQIQKLESIEWDKMHAVGLMYGANDYMSGTPVGSSYNTDYTKFDGACAYGLNKLLTKYPHLQVILFTPFYRQPNDGDIATDTDNATNSAGISMMDYGKSLRNVSDVVHCPVIDTYHCIGINKYNKPLLMKDGTHPRTTLACKRMGRLFAEQIKQYVFPLI